MVMRFRGATRIANCLCCSDTWLARPAISRRTVLAGGLAAIASTAPIARTWAAVSPFRVDVHHHYVPPVHADALTARRQQGRPPSWTAAQSLDEMDKNGIATAIVSLVQPGVWWNNVEEARNLSRECNEFAARMVADHAGRFGFWAALPLPDTEGSLRELAYALDVLKADGIGLFTSYGDKYLGDQSFLPVFEELNRRKAVVFVHPEVPDCCRGLVPSLPAPTLEFVQDTTRAIGGFLFSGTAAKCPDVRMIWSHSGGTTPFVVSRFIRLAEERQNKFMPAGVVPELGKFYYEIAQGHMPGQLDALLRIVSLEHVLFGSDYPFRSGAESVAGLADYKFKATDLRAIERDNALQLLPRLKA
jgi:6-methylsalicylate decarboxylase